MSIKYCSAIFVGDDAFDTDQGYQGKMEFIFCMTGSVGHHCTEMDSGSSGNWDTTPRSFPQVYGATFIGSGTTDTDAIMRLREGTGGEFANIIISHGTGYGVRNEKCGKEKRHSTLPSGGKFDYLFFSKNNVIWDSHGATDHKQFNTGCSPGALSAAIDVDPGLRLMPMDADFTTFMVDPRPEAGSAAYDNVDAQPAGFEKVKYKGAFGTDLWLSGLSWLDAWGKLPENVWDENPLGGKTKMEYTQSMTLKSDAVHILKGQVFFKSGTTLTIEPGTTIKALADDGNGKAPVIVIEQGAKIIAKGTKDKPITFTSALPDHALPKWGSWGGLIVLGKAPIRGSGGKNTRNIEGLEAGLGTYGGTAANDNSGVLEYVRVWMGGRDIAPDPMNPENSGNEINGITLGGVGSGTVVRNCEVAFNKDDGFEMSVLHLT